MTESIKHDLRLSEKVTTQAGVLEVSSINTGVPHAVVFVAETTGRPGFLVPGLLAAVAADLLMGDTSVTAYQRAIRFYAGKL